MKLQTVAILVSASFLISACDDSDSDNNDGNSSEQIAFEADNLLNRSANDVITQSYADLDTEAETLVTRVEALDTDGATEAEVNAAREQWKATRERWEATEAYLFGPVDTGGHDPAMDSWPLDKDNIDFSNNTDFDSKEDNLKGFHAVEFLLWNKLVTDNGGETASEAATRLDGNSDQVTYLVNAARDIEDHTTDLHSDWDPGFAETLRTAGDSGNGTYGSQSAAVQQIIEGVTIITNEVASGKIGGPFGTGTVEEVESRFSGNSINDFTNNMRGIRNVWLGTLNGSEDANGLKAFVETHDTDLTTRVEDAIDTAIAKVEAIGDPDGDDTQEVTFAEAVTNQTDSHNGETNEARIQAAIDAIQALDGLMKNEVSDLLDGTDFAQ